MPLARSTGNADAGSGAVGGRMPGVGAGRPAKITGRSQPFAVTQTQALDRRRAGCQLAQRQTAQPALQKGDVDVLPEYVSSALNFYQPNTATVDDAKNYATLKELGAAKGVTYYTPAPAKDNYAFVVTKDFSE